MTLTTREQRLVRRFQNMVSKVDWRLLSKVYNRARFDELDALAREQQEKERETILEVNGVKYTIPKRIPASVVANYGNDIDDLGIPIAVELAATELLGQEVNSIPASDEAKAWLIEQIKRRMNTEFKARL